MAQQTAQFTNLYTKKIDEVFFEAWDSKPEEWSRYLHARTSNQNNETFQGIAGGTPWTRKNEGQNSDEGTFNLAQFVLTEHTPFGKHVIMTREMIDDSKYGEVMKMAKDEGNAGRQKVEENSITILDNAFASASVNIYDGQALCSASHPYYKTGLGGVQSNLATGALSDTNVKAGLNLFNDIKDEAGKKVRFDATKLVTHKNNQWTVATIFESVNRSGTANNDTNPLPRLEYVYSTFIASLTAWFLEDGDTHELIHFFRVQPEFVKRPYREGNGDQVWDGYFRDSTAVRNWRGIVGSTGL